MKTKLKISHEYGKPIQPSTHIEKSFDWKDEQPSLKEIVEKAQKLNLDFEEVKIFYFFDLERLSGEGETSLCWSENITHTEEYQEKNRIYQTQLKEWKDNIIQKEKEQELALKIYEKAELERLKRKYSEKD